VTIRALAFAIVIPIAMSAQVPVTGRLLDPSEIPVGGVAVALRQGESELATITSETGQFRFDRVQPGEYELITTVTGFDPIRRQIRVARQPVRELVVRLRLAVLKEELDVREQERQVSVAPAQNADAISVERTMLDNLPILDNNWPTVCVSSQVMEVWNSVLSRCAAADEGVAHNDLRGAQVASCRRPVSAKQNSKLRKVLGIDDRSMVEDELVLTKAALRRGLAERGAPPRRGCSANGPGS
jgi:hypothetical protein